MVFILLTSSVWSVLFLLCFSLGKGFQIWGVSGILFHRTRHWVSSCIFLASLHYTAPQGDGNDLVALFSSYATLPL